MCCFLRNSSWSIGLFTHMESNFAQGMTICLRISPFSSILHPVRVASAHRAFPLKRKEKVMNTPSISKLRLTSRVTVNNLNILPCLPRLAEAVDVIKPWNANKSMFSWGCPKPVRALCREKHWMIITRNDSLRKARFLKDPFS